MERCKSRFKFFGGVLKGRVTMDATTTEVNINDLAMGYSKLKILGIGKAVDKIWIDHYKSESKAIMFIRQEGIVLYLKSV